jgi:hypothetical protein
MFCIFNLRAEIISLIKYQINRYYTITWLNHVISEMTNRQLEAIDDIYSKETIYNLLASAYFKVSKNLIICLMYEGYGYGV